MPDTIYLCLYLLAGFVIAFGRVIIAVEADLRAMPPGHWVTEGRIDADTAVWCVFMGVAWPIALPLDVAWCVVPWVARQMRDGAQRLFGGW